MKITLEEAFKTLNEEEISDVSSPTTEIETEEEIKATTPEFNKREAEINKARRDRDLGKTIRKIQPKMIENLWDQVYCSLTDSSDERVRNLLGNWSGHKHYAPTHVAPSTTAQSFLPKGFKTKAGYDDIIVFSPELEITSTFLDDENPSEEDKKAMERRNKKNRKQDFGYAKEVADVYHLPYQELSDAFVLYVPHSNYLNAETLDPNKVMSLFTDELISDYLNNTNQRTSVNGKSQFIYDLKPYFKQKLYDKTKKINFVENNPDMMNWVTDTADQIFADTFGVKQADNDYTEKEQKIFDMLKKKVLNQAIVVADNAIKGYRYMKKLSNEADKEKK